MLGICGGYQMLGRTIADPDGIEGAPATVQGLGHLDVATVMGRHKRLALSKATYLPTGDAVSGYEIHLGQTTGPATDRPWLSLDGRAEGAQSEDGRVMGCYLHGLFAADAFRAAYLARLGKPVAPGDYGATVQTTLDALADHVATHLDLSGLLAMAAPVGR